VICRFLLFFSTRFQDIPMESTGWFLYESFPRTRSERHPGRRIPHRTPAPRGAGFSVLSAFPVRTFLRYPGLPCWDGLCSLTGICPCTESFQGSWHPSSSEHPP